MSRIVNVVAFASSILIPGCNSKEDSVREHSKDVIVASAEDKFDDNVDEGTKARIEIFLRASDLVDGDILYFYSSPYSSEGLVEVTMGYPSEPTYGQVLLLKPKGDSWEVLTTAGWVR